MNHTYEEEEYIPPYNIIFDIYSSLPPLPDREIKDFIYRVINTIRNGQQPTTFNISQELTLVLLLQYLTPDIKKHTVFSLRTEEGHLNRTDPEEIGSHIHLIREVWNGHVYHSIQQDHS